MAPAADLMLETRARLEECALELFERDGYENVTTSQIASAAGVSVRTFFRYFPTKLDALFGDAHPRQEQFMACLRQQPRSLDLRTALLSAIVDSDQATLGNDADLVRSRILRGTPSLADALRSYETELERDLSEWIADRTGRRPDDFDVRTVSAVLVAARRVVIEEWQASDGTVPMAVLARRSLASIDVHIG